MKRLAVGLVFVGLLLGCEETPTGPAGDDLAPSVSSVGPLHYVGIDASSPVIGQPYVRQFSAVGGRPPYRWSLPNGAVAAGLTLSASGLLSGTTRDASSYAYSVRVTDADGTMEETGVGGAPNRGSNISFTMGAFALGSVVLGGETGYQPFFQGGTPPYNFTASGLPPGLTIDAGTGMISGRASRAGAYAVSIAVRDARGAVPIGSPALASLLVVRPGQEGGTPAQSSSYAGVWTGIFSLQYRMCPVGYGTLTTGSPCDRYVGADLTRQTIDMETGVLAVKAVMTVEQVTPASTGFVVLAVKKIFLSHPAFDCQPECKPAAGSVLVVETSPQSTPTINGVGLFLVGPNHSFTLTTANGTSAVEMRFGGTTLGSSQDRSIRQSSWIADIGDEPLEALAVPRLMTQPEALITRSTWVLSKGEL